MQSVPIPSELYRIVESEGISAEHYSAVAKRQGILDQATCQRDESMEGLDADAVPAQ
jgi:hypothetical protein